jgi:hypothetical protein
MSRSGAGECVGVPALGQHADVHQDDVRSLPLSGGHRGQAIGGLSRARHLVLVLDQGAEAEPYELLVVDDEYRDHEWPPIGSLAQTSKLSWGDGPAANSPSSARARSRIPAIPNPPSPDGSRVTGLETVMCTPSASYRMPTVPPRPAVPQHVGQRLLDDPIAGQVDRDGKGGGRLIEDLQMYVHTGLGHPLPQLVEPGQAGGSASGRARRGSTARLCPEAHAGPRGRPRS